MMERAMIARVSCEKHAILAPDLSRPGQFALTESRQGLAVDLIFGIESSRNWSVDIKDGETTDHLRSLEDHGGWQLQSVIKAARRSASMRSSTVLALKNGSTGAIGHSTVARG